MEVSAIRFGKKTKHTTLHPIILTASSFYVILSSLLIQSTSEAKVNLKYIIVNGPSSLNNGQCLFTTGIGTSETNVHSQSEITIHIDSYELKGDEGKYLETWYFKGYDVTFQDKKLPVEGLYIPRRKSGSLTYLSNP